MLPITIDYSTCYATKRAGDGLAPNIGHPGTSAQVTADATRATTVLNARLTPASVSGIAIQIAR